MIAPMRHRLFHAIVVVGASACGGSTETPPAPAADSATAADTGVKDPPAPDTSTAETSATDAVMMDTCVDEGCGCFPCIK